MEYVIPNPIKFVAPWCTVQLVVNQETACAKYHSHANSKGASGVEPPYIDNRKQLKITAKESSWLVLGTEYYRMSHKVIVCVEREVWICLSKSAFRNGRLQMDNAVYSCTNKNTPTPCWCITWWDTIVCVCHSNYFAICDKSWGEMGIP